MDIAKSLVLNMLFLSVVVFADSNQEIDHLLDFVANSACKFERNGNIHQGAEARDHIYRKYDHYRRKIKSAEDFIKYAATRSTLSGRTYQTHCPETEVRNTADWLLQELQAFRDS